MNDLSVFVVGWRNNDPLAHQLREQGIPHVFTYCDHYKGEAEVYNWCFRESERLGYKYVLITDSDVSFLHRETIPKMYEWMEKTPNAGSIRPWRKGERPEPYVLPEEKYIDDSTATMFRLGIGAYMDEEFVYTGWADLDLGVEIESLGYKNYNDRRYPVSHNMDGSNRHSQSSIIQAIKKANKLRLDFKRYKVGINNWKGTKAYNDSVSPEERIPTMNQLVYYSDEDQKLFQESVSPEHHQIWVKDGHINPNLTWKNPVIVGYSTRDLFEKEHGYS